MPERLPGAERNSGAERRAGSFGGHRSLLNPMVADRYGDGPPVVLLHGQPGTGWDWQWVVPLLKDSFEVIVPDRPGYGRTGGPASGFAGNAEAVIRLLDRIGLDDAVLVGHSWAGAVVLAAAQRWPQRVGAAVLVSSVGPGERIGWDDRLLASRVLGELISAVTIGGTGLVLGSRRVQRLAGQRLSGRSEDAVKALIRLTSGKASTRVWRSFVVEQRAMLHELDGLGPGLSELTMPMAIVNGGADRLVPPEVGDALASAIGSATHTVIAGAGHLLPHDEPEAIAGAVRDVQARAEGNG